MRGLKLTIDLLPKGAWGNNFSKTLSKKDWDILRNTCYEKANNRCAICGYKTEELDAHEVWDFNIKTKTQTLKDIIALCSRCHGVKHMKNSERLGYGENAKNHFLRVNNCSELDFAAHCTETEMLFQEQNKVYRWKIKADLDKFGGKGIETKERNIPKIINPYENYETINIKSSISNLSSNEYPPRICKIDVNNYDGTITIISERVNKIEWFSGDIIFEKKYNNVGKFTTKFCVENLECPSIYFKLIGDGGQIISRPFDLTSWDI